MWSDAQKASIIKYVQNGGGIAGVHNATDMGTTAETWNWWDGNNANSVIGENFAYGAGGAGWRQPASILLPRMFKIGAQFDF